MRVGQARKRGMTDVTLSTWRITATACLYGQPTTREGYAPGWSGPFHCWGCAIAAEHFCAAFDAGVKNGDWDIKGYTLADRRQQLKSMSARRLIPS